MKGTSTWEEVIKELKAIMIHKKDNAVLERDK